MSFVFEVKSKLKDWHAKLEYVLQRMITKQLAGIAKGLVKVAKHLVAAAKAFVVVARS
jgi:hypothetical protein